MHSVPLEGEKAKGRKYKFRNLGKGLLVVAFAFSLLAVPFAPKAHAVTLPPLQHCVNNSPTYRLVNPPMRGGCVWAIQAWLNEYKSKVGASWPYLAGDGIYGSQTAFSVYLYQQRYEARNGLRPDGIAGAQTKYHMFVKCEELQANLHYNSVLC